MDQKAGSEDFIYLRKSRAEIKAGDPDVLWKHRARLLEMAREDEVEIPPENIYEEIGSGATLRKRPEFRRLLERIKEPPAAPVRRLWVVDEDRISRGKLSERGLIQDALLNGKVLIRHPGGLIDLTNVSDRTFSEMKGTLGAYELGKYRERVHDAQVQMALAGIIRTGVVPFGWAWDKNLRRPVPHPERFPIVQVWCRDILHESTLALARRYNTSPAVVWYTLRNPFICGWPAKRCFPFEGTDESHCRLARPDRWIWPLQAASYEPACTREHWDLIQSVLDRRRWQRGPHNTPDAWLRDILRFRGFSLTPHVSSDHGVRCYRIGPPGLPQRIIPLDDAHAFALDLLARVVTHPDFPAAAARMLTPDPGSNAEAALLEQGLAQQRDKLVRLKEEAAEGDDEDWAANRQAQANVKREIERLKRELSQTRKQSKPEPEAVLLADLLREVPSVRGPLRERLAGLPPATLASLARVLIAELTADVLPVEGTRRHRREIVAYRLRPALEKLAAK